MNEKIIQFSNGVRVINTTPHELTFLDGDQVVTVPTSGVIINAKMSNEETVDGAVTYCSPTFSYEPASEIALEKLEKDHPGVIILGSMIAAQAYSGRVCGMISAPGFERVSPAEKRMSTCKFTRY